MGKRITEDQINYIRNHYLSDSYEDIAEKINLHPDTVRKLGRKLFDLSKRIRVAGFRKFKTIPGFSGYRVSRKGTVVTSDKGYLMVPYIYKNGYHAIKLFDDTGKRRHQKIHRLVAIVYIPNPNNLPEVNHLNGKGDNGVESLEWVTKEDNIRHAIAEGIHTAGCTYTQDQIHEACKLMETGEYRNIDIVRILNMSKYTVGNIRNKKRWTHISDQYDF